VLEDRSVPSFGWAAGTGGSAVATDAAGNVYMTGSFSSTFTPAGSSVALNSAGGIDIFVAKYSRVGAFQWAVSMGGAQDDYGNSIAVDSAGSQLYVVGAFNGANVANLDGATGAARWTRNIAGNYSGGVSVDGSGNAYVVSKGSATPYAAYVTKLNSVGSQQWQDTLANTTNPLADPSVEGVAVSGTSVFVSGVSWPGTTVTVGSGTYAIPGGKSGPAGFVLKLTSNNQFGWTKTFQPTGRGGWVVSCYVAVDNSGDAYASGNFTGYVNFANTDKSTGQWVLNGTAIGNGSVYVAKLDSAGTVGWAKMIAAPSGNSNAAEARSIAVDGAGAVCLTGYFQGTVSFNPAGGGNLTSAGGSDVFVVKLDTSGAFQWAVRAGGAGNDSGRGIAVDSFGDIYATGSIGAGTADFDPLNTYLDNRDLVTTAAGGGFLWQLTQP
jgi:hypothetical protein